MTLKKLFIFLLIIASLDKLFGQVIKNQDFFVSPGITIGYTLGAKINYGFVLDFGLINKNSNLNLHYGFSYYHYYVRTKAHVHRLRSFSVMAQTDFLDIKLGVGRAKNPWGLGERNRCIVHGLCLDISATYPNLYSPWLGYRYFKYHPADWAWFFRPYNSFYLKYKYDLIQNTSLAETLKLE